MVMGLYQLKYDKRFCKDLEKIPTQFRERLNKAIEGLKDAPKPMGYKKLKGYENLYRIRIGDYRICYQIHENVVVVVLITVAHRREVYKNLQGGKRSPFLTL